jgi:predicted transposase YbfD/YdcC
VIEFNFIKTFFAGFSLTNKKHLKLFAYLIDKELRWREEEAGEAIKNVS